MSAVDPIFDSFPHLGFETGDAPEQRCQFVFTRSDPKPNDWDGDRTISSDRVPGSNRTLSMDMGAEPLTLTTSLMFVDAGMYQRFRAMRVDPVTKKLIPGTLRMNAAYTMWPGRTLQILNRLYTEFDNVLIRSIAGQTFDLTKHVHCTVVFEREDLS